MKNKTWFIADTHFNHLLMLKTRNFETIYDHNFAVADSISRCLKPDDVLCILGDFSFGGLNKHIFSLNLLLISYNKIHKTNYEKLPYKIRLVMGNHDQNKYIHRITKNDSNKRNDENYGVMFDSVHGSLVFDNYDGSKIVFTHIPVHPINLSNGERRYWTANVHGHIHQYKVPDDSYFCVSWDHAKRPLSLDEIQDIFKNRFDK